jgi:regulatory protein
MVIDRIETLDKRRKKIFADGEFVFTLYLGEIRQFGREEGGELTEEVYQKILHEIVFKRARERAVYWLKCSARTEEELRRKLRDGGYPLAAADYAVELLKKYRYIDDEEYARNFMEVHARGKSRAELAALLSRKGISRECVSQLMQENPVDEEEQIRHILKKRRFHPEEADQKELSKQIAYLVRKGFSYDAVRRVLSDSFVR